MLDVMLYCIYIAYNLVTWRWVYRLNYPFKYMERNPVSDFLKEAALEEYVF